jgi:hypothetical protein
MERETASEERLGYFVPEDIWLRLEEASEALAALRDIADSSPRGVVTNSDRLQSLIRMFHDQLQTVAASGEFCTRP